MTFEPSTAVAAPTLKTSDRPSRVPEGGPGFLATLQAALQSVTAGVAAAPEPQASDVPAADRPPPATPGVPPGDGAAIGQASADPALPLLTACQSAPLRAGAARSGAGDSKKAAAPEKAGQQGPAPDIAPEAGGVALPALPVPVMTTITPIQGTPENTSQAETAAAIALDSPPQAEAPAFPENSQAVEPQPGAKSTPTPDPSHNSVAEPPRGIKVPDSAVQPASQPHAQQTSPAPAPPEPSPAAHAASPAPASAAAYPQVIPRVAATVVVLHGPSVPQGATRQVVIQLEPADLGRVEIRIERTETGPATVDLAVERPETLRLLLEDRPMLEQALDRAGLLTEGRVVAIRLADDQSFLLQAPEPVAVAPPSSAAHGSLSPDGGGQHSPHQPPPRPAAGRRVTEPFIKLPLAERERMALQSTGLNITA